MLLASVYSDIKVANDLDVVNVAIVDVAGGVGET